MPDSGSPARGHARRADAVRNAQLLVAAARELFDQRGPDVAMDEVARRAGVGNATLYRNFPTRGDLLAAAYADEVAALCRRGAALLAESPPGEALYAWLDSFVIHVATKRALALAATAASDERRSELFGSWHESMGSTAEGLLARAQEARAIRPGLTVTDLLALASAVALASATPDHARHLLEMMRHGLAGAQDAPGSSQAASLRPAAPRKSLCARDPRTESAGPAASPSQPLRQTRALTSGLGNFCASQGRTARGL